VIEGERVREGKERVCVYVFDRESEWKNKNHLPRLCGGQKVMLYPKWVRM